MQQAEITANFYLGKRLPNNGNEPIFHFLKLNGSSASESNVFPLLLCRMLSIQKMYREHLLGALNTELSKCIRN